MIRRSEFSCIFLVSVAALISGAFPGDVRAGELSIKELDKWLEVTLDPATGAACGDGSPYRFYYRRNPAATRDNWVIQFEGGGVCVDYESCTGKAELSAFNPNGIRPNYMGSFSPLNDTVRQVLKQGFITAASTLNHFATGIDPTAYLVKALDSSLTLRLGSVDYGLVSPFSSRATVHVDASARLKLRLLKDREFNFTVDASDQLREALGLAKVVPYTADWNQVFLPYCTGDLHFGGGKTALLRPSGVGGPARVQHYFGHRNVMKAVGHLATKILKGHAPDRLFVFGWSAGGHGATLNYDAIREMLNPRESYLLNDSGMFSDIGLLTPESYADALAGLRLMQAGAKAGRADAEAWRQMAVFRKFAERSHAFATMLASFDAWGTFAADGDDGPLNRLGKSLHKYRGDGGAAVDPLRIMSDLAEKYPDDKFAFASFREDKVMPRFLYDRSDPKIITALKQNLSDDYINMKFRAPQFRSEINNLRAEIDRLRNHQGNIGYYLPDSRPLLKSHTVSVATFLGTEVRGRSCGLDSNDDLTLGDYVNAMIGRGSVLACFEAVPRQAPPQARIPFILWNAITGAGR